MEFGAAIVKRRGTVKKNKGKGRNEEEQEGLGFSSASPPSLLRCFEISIFVYIEG